MHGDCDSGFWLSVELHVVLVHAALGPSLAFNGNPGETGQRIVVTQLKSFEGDFVRNGHPELVRGATRIATVWVDTGEFRVGYSCNVGAFDVGVAIGARFDGRDFDETDRHVGEIGAGNGDWNPQSAGNDGLGQSVDGKWNRGSVGHVRGASRRSGAGDASRTSGGGAAGFATVGGVVIGVEVVGVARGEGSASASNSGCAGGTNAVGDSSTARFATVRRITIGVKLVGVA